MNNDYAGHPTFNYAAFEAYYISVFGNDCIVELYQDGEIWSDDEYWGSTLYDITDGKIYDFCVYLQTSEEWEKLIGRTKKYKEVPWDETINEHLKFSPGDIDAYEFYKSFINSKSSLDLKDYYNNEYKKQL